MCHRLDVAAVFGVLWDVLLSAARLGSGLPSSWLWTVGTAERCCPYRRAFMIWGRSRRSSRRGVPSLFDVRAGGPGCCGRGARPRGGG
ncbi:hypothetical protein ACP4I1_34210 [Streptomyces sp. WG4]|uniref:hypothetical protein n=1 Tax=Streptomyces sp. WG4 TaxID=3417649 RepID=UPI003CF17253